MSHILNSVGTVLLSVTVKKYDEKYLTAYISSELRKYVGVFSDQMKFIDSSRLSRWTRRTGNSTC